MRFTQGFAFYYYLCTPVFDSSQKGHGFHEITFFAVVFREVFIL